MFWNEHRETWSFSLLSTWSKVSSTKKNRRIGKKSVPQTACLLSVVDKYTAELSFGSSRNTLSRRAQISAEICIKLFTRRRIKCRDRRRCFSISLNFHQAILEPSPQTRFMFDIKKLLFMNALTFYSQRNTELRSICPNSVEFPKHAGHITDYSKAESTLWPATLHYSTNSVCYCFALLCFITT